MRWPWRRKQTEPVVLRDFTDLTGFAFGRGVGSTVTVGAALRHHGGWLGIAVRPVVDRIAGLRWQAITDAGEEIEKAPVLDLLRSPNVMCDGGMLLRVTAQALVMSGEAYLLKVRGRRSGRPRQLLPISPDRVERVWKDDGSIEYHVAPGSGAGEPEVHPAEDMVRIWRPLPSDPWEPYGVTSMLVHEIEAENGWRESVRNWFEHDARPQMVSEFPEEFEQLTQSPGWEQYVSEWRQLQSRRGANPAFYPLGAKCQRLAERYGY